MQKGKGRIFIRRRINFSEFSRPNFVLKVLVINKTWSCNLILLSQGMQEQNNNRTALISKGPDNTKDKTATFLQEQEKSTGVR